MAVIADAIEEASQSDAGDSPDRDDATAAPPDVFFTSFDTERIKLDDETAERLLGLAVVLSNLFS